DDEADRMPPVVLAHAVAVSVLPAEAVQDPLGALRLVVEPHDAVRSPLLAADRGRRPVLEPVAVERPADHGVAIDRHRHRAPELAVREPPVLRGINRRLTSAAGAVPL